jgi:hypothetical protein
MVSPSFALDPNRRWMRDGGAAPPEVDAWLAKLAAFHTENPPPARAARAA